ncbi:DUF4349 domain-containing protein [Actinokineospora enzanensis]|uniref:DUF4349 domain-containing protein n=1 Tax=Actinokineospora enzanensis TaxID=155975 RepID=UPI0003A18163|nr:DUF4349 domain-containing protein [Actinokineospora enzanensis]
MVRRTARVAGLVLTAGVLIGAAACTSTQGESAAGMPMMTGVPQRPDTAGGYDSGGAKAEANSGAARGTGAAPEAPGQSTGGPAVPQPGVDRKLVRTASLELSSPKVADAAASARREAAAAGGYSGQEQVDDDLATLTLYVPSDRLDQAVERLRAVGTVRNQGQTAQDVTEQVVDVDSRIETQRASLNRVRALLDRATSMSEIVQLESEVSRRESDLESLLKRRDALAGSVAMSTVSVRITREGAPVPAVENRDSLGGALGDGWSAFVSTVKVVVLALARLLPFVLVIGVPGYLIWRARRNRPGRTVSPPSAPTSVPPGTGTAHEA